MRFPTAATVWFNEAPAATDDGWRNNVILQLIARRRKLLGGARVGNIVRVALSLLSLRMYV